MSKPKLKVAKVVAWYNSHNCNATATARKFNVSRQTVHAYLNRVAPIASRQRVLAAKSAGRGRERA